MSNPRSGKSRTRRKVARPIDIPQDVFLAASVGDLEWLRHAVAGWSSKSEIPYDQNGFSPLHVAAAHARLDCIKHFVEHLRYNPNLPSKAHGWLPIHVVINHLNDDRTLPCLNYLILKGANVNGMNSNGTTALHQAAAEGDTESIKALLDRGASPVLEDMRGCTPLRLSRIWGHREAARVLENAIWRLSKDGEAKVKQAKLLAEKVEALGDVKTAVDKFAKAPEDSLSALGNWMRGHGLDDNSTKHIKREKLVHPIRRLKNSIPDPPESPYNRPRAEAMTRRHSASPRVTRRHGDMNAIKEIVSFAISEGDEDEDDESGDFGVKKNVRSLTLEQLRAYHAKPWTKSTRIGEYEYVTNLKDIYPRDEYSMLPTRDSAPFLSVGNIREAKSMETINEQMRQVRYEGKGCLPPQRFEPSGRPVVFKPFRNILDVGPLRKPDQNSYPRDEIALHLVTDPNSYLFKFSLQPGVLSECQAAAAAADKTTQDSNNNNDCSSSN